MSRVVAIFLAGFALLTGEDAMSIEQPDYEVIANHGDIEFRRYAPYLVAEVTVSGAAPDREAFNILAGYIFGKNSTQEKMSMTAPVETRGQDYAFVMEKKYSEATLPEPDDERIRVIRRPERIVAVKRFSGRWSESNFAANERELLQHLQALNIRIASQPELARYNAPFTPWFLRRNEIIVAIDHQDLEKAGLVATTGARSL